jgi:hypothetical protein
MSTTSAKSPEILDKIVDVVLAYKAKPKNKIAKKKNVSQKKKKPSS